MARVLCEQEYFAGDGTRVVYQAQMDNRVFNRVSRQKQRNRHRVPSVVRWPVQLPFFSPPKCMQAPGSDCTDLRKKPPVRPGMDVKLTKKTMCENVSTIPFSFECEQKNPVIPVEKSDTPVAGDVKKFINLAARRWFRKLYVPLARHRYNQLYRFIHIDMDVDLAPDTGFDDYVVIVNRPLTSAFQKLSVR